MVRVEPVNDRLVIDASDSAEAAEVWAFQVEAHGLPLGLVRVAKRERVRSVEASTCSTLITLAAAQGASVSSLVFC